MVMVLVVVCGWCSVVVCVVKCVYVSRYMCVCVYGCVCVYRPVCVCVYMPVCVCLQACVCFSHVPTPLCSGGRARHVVCYPGTPSVPVSAHSATAPPATRRRSLHMGQFSAPQRDCLPPKEPRAFWSSSVFHNRSKACHHSVL